MLKILTISMFVSIGLGIVVSLGFVMCGREPTYDIRPEPVERREPMLRREPVIHADDRSRTYSPLEDM